MSIPGITFSSNPTAAQLKAAADLIDAGGQLNGPLDRKKLAASTAVIVALNADDVVVGTAALKPRIGDLAELGYLIVHPDYRRRGIAQELTRMRIAAAGTKGIVLIFSNVRSTNQASCNNLKNEGFRYWGDFLTAHGTGNVISWFYMPLRPDLDEKRCMATLTKDLAKSPAS